MAEIFESIPGEVIDFIRDTFRRTNDKVSSALTLQPSYPEESLDNLLVNDLTAVPPTFFASSKAAVVIESHFLGKRHMYESWEIADVAFLITIRLSGRLAARKVTLLQTKRLYSKELAGAELEKYDFEVGIGRLFDKIESTVPLFPQRVFHFDPNCMYEALTADSRQMRNIDRYAARKQIDVYYGLYNPMTVPFVGKYPWADNVPRPADNVVGLRVIPSKDVHKMLGSMKRNETPSYKDLTFPKYDPQDGVSEHGWRLERFVADEVMKCRHGRLFTTQFDEDLNALFYERGGPIAAGISITIDLASEG